MSSVLERGLIEVGYFLSRLGIDEPPNELNAKTWKEAYLKFYGTFGLGKTEAEFKNSLKNLRDHFDSHLNNNRVGWMEAKNLPQQLSSTNQEVFDELQKLSDDKLWNRIRNYAVLGYDSNVSNHKIEKTKEEGAKYFSSEFSGNKKIANKASVEFTTSHGLVVDNLKFFVENSIKNSFAYNTQKIDLAVEINGKLTHLYEVKTATDTQSIYTAVGQLFMHSAGTTDAEKWIVLPSPIENAELIECLTILGISILQFKLQGDNCVFVLNDSFHCVLSAPLKKFIRHTNE